MIEQFFHRNLNIINYFIRKGRNDPHVIALILAEMYFNNIIKRQSEYLAFLLLRSLFKKRISKLSVGIAQIQIKYWYQYNLLNDQNIFKKLAIISSELNNYDLAKMIIDNRLNEPVDCSKILADYRGESRAYHMDVFIKLKYFIGNYCG